MNTLYLLCGKTGSGKSTYAAKLEAERRAFRLTLDELMLPLFGPELPRPEFEQRLSSCKECLLAIAERLLAFGVDIALDWGFWSKAERLTLRQRFTAAGVRCELIYFEVPDTELLDRLRRRNAHLPAHTYAIDDAMFAALSRYFEPPESDEAYVRITAISASQGPLPQ